MEWLFQLPVLMFSVVVHEFCHGWVASVCGDDTAERAGRLTLDPAAHVDPFGTIFMPMLCVLTGNPMFGWAKPVPINSKQMKDPRRDAIRVALVGPLANVVLAFGAAILFKVVSVIPGVGVETRGLWLEVILFTATLNLFLAFFNLLPVHPLDGSKVLGGVLAQPLAKLYNRHIPYGGFIILVMLVTGMLGAIVMPAIRVTLDIWGWIGLLG
ncbi:MAG: site-2 protease family protein [Elusimicrobia bacterium]|nr:MAG: site-2 protease family protein [Elusimicrobiota bacterium]